VQRAHYTQEQAKREKAMEAAKLKAEIEKKARIEAERAAAVQNAQQERQE
jgi:hypothetical protein